MSLWFFGRKKEQRRSLYLVGAYPTTLLIVVVMLWFHLVQFARFVFELLGLQ